MAFRHVWRYFSYLSLMVVAGLLMAGCVIQEPPALGEIAKARKSLDEAVKSGRADCVQDKYVDLEKRYLQARGVFYACNDAEAARLAQAVAAEANALACPSAAPMPAGNRPPVCRVTVSERAQAGESVQFDASASADPDGDALTYTWDFGDGTAPVRVTFPRTTHAYTRAGNYAVKVTVDDGRGGICTGTGTVAVVLRVVLQEKGGKVLFDFNKATLRPEGLRQLGVVVQALKEQPNLLVHIVGHTDGVGSDAYNMKLSQQRAESVAHYLESQGVRKPSITTDWRGKREPIASNATAAGRAQNRRVEITLSPPAR